MEDGEVIRPGDPAAGIKRLMAAFRELVGRTAVELKAEALEIYHKKLHRRSGERVGDWCTRFRNHVVQTRQEGAEPPAQDQGFMLRGRSGLSEAQVQLLDTVTNGDLEPRLQGRRGGDAAPLHLSLIHI